MVMVKLGFIAKCKGDNDGCGLERRFRVIKKLTAVSIIIDQQRAWFLKKDMKMCLKFLNL